MLKTQSADKAFGIKLRSGYPFANLKGTRLRNASLEELEELTETLQLLTESNVVYIYLDFVG